MAYLFAGLLALLALAGLVHAFKMPKDKAFAAPDHTNGKVTDQPLVTV